MGRGAGPEGGEQTMSDENAADIQASADVSPGAQIGARTRIWHLAQVREGAKVGTDCVIGRSAYIGPGAVLGDACKVQNHALVYEPARLGHGVFIGPAVVLTNDEFPRAVNPDGTLKSADDWTMVGVVIEDGASLGARSVCVAPVTIGAWSLIAAGSVVIRDVPAFALMAGVPARRIGWVGHAGHPLREEGEFWVCPASARRYAAVDGELVEASGGDL